MTAGDAYEARVLTNNVLDAAISAYLANPLVLVIGTQHFEIATGFLA